ncbi:MAG: dihydrodipicolinate synthase family protein [Actinobacteria bacterium]|nr:dihydrodipicolinate synthase family protein [Actinomycetota bacterium]
MSPDLRGIIPIVYTPFDPSGAIDRHSLQRLVDYLVAAGAHGLAMTGQASESAWLGHDQRRQLAEWTAASLSGRLPLIAGVNAGNTADAVACARHAVACGAQVVFCAAPGAGPVGGEALVRHFHVLADAVPVPVMIQNTPSAPLSADLIARAASHQNIRYVKEESTHAGHMVTAVQALRPDLRLFTGGKNPVADLARGAVGGIPGSVGVADLAACHNAAVRNDLAEARQRLNHVAPLLLAIASNPLAWAKEILRRLGVIAHAGTISPHARGLDAADQAELTAVMDSMGPPY